MENFIWGNILLLVALITVFTFVFKSKIPKYYSEGFTQKEKFILKKNENVYDEFYVDMYDKIHLPHRRIPYEIKFILNTTQADESNSLFLDIGSGTGHIVNELNNLGYTAFGIDKSEAMINYCKRNENSRELFKRGDVEDSLLFENRKFTHILCLYFTIYHFKNKNTFFHNCCSWLKPGGYLILHLVEKDKFDTVAPVGNNLLFGSPQKQSQERITTQTVVFNDFKYKYSYDFTKGSQIVELTETFQDAITENIRQNERTLYMEDINNILKIAVANGFVPNANVAYNNNILPNPFKGEPRSPSSNSGDFSTNITNDFTPLCLNEINGDSHQYLYILERSLV